MCSRPEGNTDQGLCDMAGNVSEFVQDWYRIDYRGVPRDGTAYEDGWGIYRVCRGGSWAHGAMGVRVSARDRKEPDSRIGSLGFRIVRSLDLSEGGMGPDEGDSSAAATPALDSDLAARLDAAWQSAVASEFAGDRARALWHYHEFLLLAEGVGDRREAEARATISRLRASGE